MSYQVLARKWRPRSFEEVLGQAHVVRALRNGLELDRIHHAYLFAGTRGVGKTTLARILARCLNCESGITPVPCGECSACRQIIDGRFVDLVEVDAASRTGVDDMRELLDGVHYAPGAGRFRIYLIDEVHMLSLSSFNALLKTLEEPPEHIKFFFATTHPGKLPITILSRCLQFHLTRLSPDEIREYLASMLAAESVEYEDTALAQIALVAEGSVRDSLSLLDQAIAYGNGSLKTQEVQAMLGLVGYGEVVELLRRLAANDASGVVNLVDAMYAKAVDFAGVLNRLIGLLHTVAVQQAVSGADVPAWFDADKVRSLAEDLTPEDTQLFYQIALNGKRDLPFLPDARSAFEMTMLRMLGFRPAQDAAHADKKVDESASRPSAQTVSGASSPLSSPERSDTRDTPSTERSRSTRLSPPERNGTRAESRREAETSGAKEKPGVKLTDFSDKWTELAGRLQLKGAEKQICFNSTFSVQSEVEVTLSVDEHLQDIKTQAIEDNIRNAFSRVANRDVKVNFTSVSSDEETPQQQQDRARLHRQYDAECAIDDNAVVRSLKDTFGAEVIAGKTRSSSDPAD